MRYSPDLPSDFPAALLAVQHVAPRHKSHLAEILSRRTALRIKQSEDGDWVFPGMVFIAPPDRHLVMRSDGTLALTHLRACIMSVRPSGDVLFCSMAKACGKCGIAVVLTGGVLAVKAAGGTVIAQDEAYSEHFAMF